MRFSPTKILQGLLCTAPILLLTLAACGGGGGGGTTASLAAAYTLGGAVSGVSGTGLVLRNNGGDDIAISSGAASYVFSTSVIAATSYNVTVLTNPSSQLCTVANASGIMPAYAITNANVSCNTAYTVGGNITGDTLATGLVLQNNGGDNLLVPAAATSFTFDTPLLGTDSYNVTVLTQPHTPAQTCVASSNSGTVGTGITTVSINCTNDATLPLTDKFVYAANFGSTGTNGVSPYTSASGVLTAGTVKNAQSAPSSIAVDAGQFAYVTNYSSNTISAYSINSLTGALTALTDVDAGTSGNQPSIATGTHPYSMAIHPSGKYAYVTNAGSNSVSAYSIGSDGALSRIDSDGATAGNQTSIAARSGPVSIAIDPTGSYAYVANSGDASVSVYRINANTGALTAIDADGSGGSSNTYISTETTPYSVVVDPSGTYVYVVNYTSNSVSIFQIGNAGAGTLSLSSTKPTTDGTPTAGITPYSIAIHPAGGYAYVVNTGSNTVNVYSTTDTVGTLVYKSQAATGNSPSSISIDSTGQHAYVTNYVDNTVSSYSINTGTGALTLVDTKSTGTHPNAVTTAR